MKMTTVYFNGQLENGSFIYGAKVILKEDYTMNQLVAAIKNKGYVSFMAENMKRLVDIK